MGRFSGVREARISNSGVYFLQGLYTVEVQRVYMLTSRKREDFFVVESKILESDNAERRPGMTCTWMVKMSQDAALGNIKAFVSAATDTPADEIDEDSCELVVDDDNPLAGTVMKLEVVDITTREGNPFSLHKWHNEAA